MKLITIALIVMLAGCSYNGHNDPNIQWQWQSHKDFPQSARQAYFSNNIGDKWVRRFMCIA